MAALQRLHREGYRLVMLTGDNPVTANAIAKEAGIDEVIAGVLPDGKAQAIKDLQAQGQKVAMIGHDLALDDGVGICGKDGQSVPVGVGQPSLLISELTVGGTMT